MTPSDAAHGGVPSRRSLAELIEAARAADQAARWDDALEGYEAAFQRAVREGAVARAAELLRWIATVHRELGELDVAEDIYLAGLAVAEANGLEEQTAPTLNCLATVELLRGRLDEAEPLYVRTRAAAEAVDDVRTAAAVEQNLGILANIRGDLGLALARYRSALDRFRRLGDEPAAIRVLNNLGMTQVDLGQFEAAEAFFREAYELAERIGDPSMAGTVELNRADLYLKRQQFEHARASCDRALEIFTRLKAKARVAEAYKLYGVLHRETSRPHLAGIHLALALGLAQDAQDRLLEAEAESEWGLVHLDEGRTREALRCFNRAHRLFTDLRARRDLLDVERRLEALQQRYLPVVTTWGADALEAKDWHLQGHTRRVADYSAILGRAAGLDAWHLTMLRIGALVHDVGKTAIPTPVLRKPGPLTPKELELMRSHPVVGDGMVAELEFPGDVRPIVRHHHEHWNGSGYPDGLRGEAIPLAARIVCVADIFDSLTSARSYRPAFSRKEALRIMEGEAGRVLDPDLFEAFRALVPEVPAA